jgi:hypothetical protein
MEGASRVIRLELRLDGESPIGRASTPDDGERDFAGWLGLIAAIEALAERPEGDIAPDEAATRDIHDDPIR